MGDKAGGKGYSRPKGAAKSALKTPLSAGPGLNNGSTKSRKGMNVQFEFEDCGGKGDKVANGGKIPVAKPIRPLQLRVEEELPENVTCLMDYPTVKIPLSFDKGLQRSKKGNDYASPQSVKEALQNLKNHGVADSEICLIANIHPESADEAKYVLDKGKKKKLLEPLKSALGELAKIDCSA
ncbi:hypothetical protein POM88_014488 [Heracleum sosnowskyi]|uniref:RNA polymerase Rpb4/RPC9 core domain-containing protein n=1 Tax=Heracleum sosnowskyi TaxID=360622 RepID=A0AAD8N479_9APIA|nr:hypothetical protein POM88_014488 [Heracleum sosnowskyi]